MHLLRRHRHQTLQLVEHHDAVRIGQVHAKVLDLTRELAIDLEAVEDRVAVGVDCNQERCVSKVQDT